ncbi:hypothetical protein [Gymnodinialimonas ulvae]|uniref:hypothetical protein n=1 Tax=Gymnodinialimonas ulvae TaxID=3126504 RepID=UPI0030A03434
MGIGDMIGGLMGGAGDAGIDGILEKLGAAGIDASALQDLDLEAVTSLLGENGIDLSMLEGLGISVEDIIAKVTGQA